MANRRGFTVVELVIAIVVVGILAAIAFPSLANLTAPFRVSSAGREVYSALQEVRQQSITRGARTRFQVNGASAYTLQWDSLGTWKTIRGPMQLEKNVLLTSSGGTVVFQPRGTASPLTTIRVYDALDDDREMVISIPITGLVRIQKGGG